jgi:predicted membrane channel-forming protein YqfA (hemolysin III family)
VVALIVLLTKAAGRVDQLLAFGIFGLSLVALYGASACWRWMEPGGPDC